MPGYRYIWTLLALALLVGASSCAPAIKEKAAPPPEAPKAPPPPKGPMAPDHGILYRRAVTLLEQAQKKLAGRYTAEARNMVREAASLFAILRKECAQALQGLVLSPGEQAQQETHSQNSEGARAEGERLMAAGAEKEKKSDQAKAQGVRDLARKYLDEAKGDYDQAEIYFVRAEIFALKIQELILSFCGR